MREVGLVDLPVSAAEYVQRVGRAVRFNGHAGLPPAENNVCVRLYVAKLPGDTDDSTDADVSSAPERSADEIRLQELEVEVKSYSGQLDGMCACLGRALLCSHSDRNEPSANVTVRYSSGPICRNLVSFAIAASPPRSISFPRRMRRTSRRTIFGK